MNTFLGKLCHMTESVESMVYTYFPSDSEVVFIKQDDEDVFDV